MGQTFQLDFAFDSSTDAGNAKKDKSGFNADPGLLTFVNRVRLSIFWSSLKSCKEGWGSWVSEVVF
jgi:hypothetical protein